MRGAEPKVEPRSNVLGHVGSSIANCLPTRIDIEVFPMAVDPDVVEPDFAALVVAFGYVEQAESVKGCAVLFVARVK